MPIEGLETAARALAYWQRRHEVMANNLANASTAGFKGERVFGTLLEGRTEAFAATDLSAGALTPTGRPLDLALEGGGFLVVDTPEGEMLTRGGSFTVAGDGRLLDGAGNALQGEDGPLVVPPGTVSVGAGGEVRVGGEVVGTLRRVAAPAGLEHRGAGLYAAPGQPLEAGGATVRAGFLEESNVDAVSSMAEMIEIQRSYGAVQRSMTVLDEVMASIAKDIGRVQ